MSFVFWKFKDWQRAVGTLTQTTETIPSSNNSQVQAKRHNRKKA